MQKVGKLLLFPNLLRFLHWPYSIPSQEVVHATALLTVSERLVRTCQGCRRMLKWLGLEAGGASLFLTSYRTMS